MDTPLDLHDLEERTFRSRFGDGLLDLLVGLFVLSFGLSIGTDLAGLGGVWAAVLVPLWMPLHKKIIEPRLGYIEFSKERQARNKRSLGVLTIALGISFLAGVGLWVTFAMEDTSLREAAASLGPIPFALMLGTILAVGASLVKLTRGYVYAGLVVSLVTLGHVLDVENGFRLSLSAAGAAITLSGVVILARFLGAHPVLDAGPDDDRP